MTGDDSAAQTHNQDKSETTVEPPVASRSQRRSHPSRKQTPGHAHGHGHGHGHGPVRPASRNVRRLLTFTLLPFVLAALTGVALLYPFGHDQRTGADLGLGQYPVKGEIVAAHSGSCSNAAPSAPSGSASPECLRLQVAMADGPRAGKTIKQTVPLGHTTPRFAVGDKIVLSYAGARPDMESSYQLVDFQRGGSLVVLGLMFAGAVLVLGRWKGFAALIGLGLSFLVLIGFVLPAILAGQDPLLVSVVGAGTIMFLVLYLTHGFSARTSTAVLGTLISLSLIGVLSAAFSAASRLTGLDDSTASLIGALNAPIDPRGLLLAGVVIGALGVLDDVTVTQTSAVWELRAADPTMSWRRLYSAGLRIGRDHVASAVNTLVLAYAGAALPLLLAYSLSGRGFAEIITTEAVAQEVVRTLVGSVGLVAAVPITTAIAATVAIQEPADTELHAARPDPGSDRAHAAERIRTAAATSASTPRLRSRSHPGSTR